MFGALAGEAGRAQALKDKSLAEEGFVYLAERGEKYLKHVDELSPSDVPNIPAFAMRDYQAGRFEAPAQ